MTDIFKNFALDPENTDLNFQLGCFYENAGHLASATSYFLRAAERATDNLIAYESLIRLSICFINQKNQSYTAKQMLYHALNLCPTRPEAYYLLSVFFETQEQWIECYSLACLGINLTNFNTVPLKTHVGYPGKHGLLLQRARAAWTWGKFDEAKNVFNKLKEKYWDKLNDDDQKTVNDYLKI